MKLYPTTVGCKRYDSRPVTATDPCYKKTSDCVIKNIHVKPGKYRCVAWKGRLSYTDDQGKCHQYSRVFICGVYLNDFIPKMEDGIEIGTIGVDAGLAGFFQDKPDYDDEKSWLAFCDKINKKNYLITDEGFCTESGFGDGGYPVYKFENENGEIVGLEIRF